MNMTSKGQVTIPKAIRDRFERVRGSADSGMTTEQILSLTRYT
jgi:bifunctional DNA-binding transcriptional regulator/antitoxin component of YhaV-PrlF toxin-antitoxin module